MAAMGTVSFTELLMVLVLAGLYVIPLWRIAGKMGYPGALGVLACIPGINLVVAWILAFREWPVERKARS